jgi:hypothetical protein
MATNKLKRGDDLTPLEGGATGGGGAGIKGTKWSSMPSLRGSSSTIDDLKKLGSDTSKLKGSAKTSKEAAIQRAADRTLVRAGAAGAAAAGAAAAGAAALTSESKPRNGSDNEFMGSVRADPKNPTGVEGTGMAKGGMVKKKTSAYNAVYMGKDKRK